MQAIRRTLQTETRVLDERKGLVEYIASDESLDSYREIIRVAGWRFTNFQKNAPLVDSHDYSCIDKLLGKVVDFKVKGGRLIETVQWAIDAGLPDNHLANIGWKMTLAGYLKAVSVGFYPTKMIDEYGDASTWKQQLKELGLSGADKENHPRRIYIEQEQVELSVCILGANPNALAKAFRASVINASQRDFLGNGPGSAARRLVDEAVARLPFPSAVTSEQRRKIAADILPFPEVFE